MRGKREPDTDALYDIRNIPAYAGKTAILSTKSPILTGTSPRMRGKRALLINALPDGRNIPAYAGKTCRAG